MKRRKKGIAIFLVVIVLSSIGYIYFYGFYPNDSDDTTTLEITPHEYNSLNWWDLAWEFSTVSDFLTYLSALQNNPNRHHDANPDGYYESAEYIQSLLQGWGISATFEGTFNSLMGYQKGYGNNNRAIVFGTPLDTTSSTSTVNQGAGVAVLTQIAQILHRFRLPFDIYYCYYSYSYYTIDTVRAYYGSQDLVDYFIENDVDIIASYHMENLLFYDPNQAATEAILVEYALPGEYNYQSSIFLSELLDEFLLQNGYNILTGSASESYSADYLSFLEKGIPAVNIRSGHQIDPDFPPNDAVYSSDYNREHASALAQALASIAIFLGNSGNKEPIKHTLTTTLQPNSAAFLRTVMSTSQTLEISGIKNETSSVNIQVIGEGSTITQGDVSGLEFSLKTGISTGLGPVQIRTQNLGESSLEITIDVIYEMDVDGNGVFDSDQYIWDDPNPPLDWDRDALSDTDEELAGTDIFVADTDMDEMTDGFEVLFGLDPLRDDTLEDLDQDGLTNIREYQLGTHPNDTDSDHDLMDDAWEVSFLTDPTIDDASLDFDNDTLTNLEEYTYGADPHSADGDFDGVLDVEEIARGMDALSADSDGDGLRDQLELIEGLDPLVPDYDIDLSPDGPDHNPRINSLVVIFGLALIPVLLGTVYFSKRLK